MKKILMLALMVFTTFCLSAQEETKNNHKNFIGLSLRGSVYQNKIKAPDNAKANIKFNLVGSFGRQLSKNTSVGVNLDYTMASFLVYNNSLGSYTDEGDIHQGGISLFLRQNIWNYNDRLHWYIEPHAGYFYGQSKVFSPSDIKYDNSPYDFFDMGIRTGLIFDIDDRFRVTTSLKGLHYTKNLGLNLNVESAKIGFEYRF